MKWDEARWNRHIRNARSALTKRDSFFQGGGVGEGWSIRDAGHRRDQKACASQARTNLKSLAALARHAPDRPGAEETVRRLLVWYENPPN